MSINSPSHEKATHMMVQNNAHGVVRFPVKESLVSGVDGQNSQITDIGHKAFAQGRFTKLMNTHQK
jgi:hypothetical protein